MSPAAFERLLERRDALKREHDTACLILDEEGSGRGGANYDRCAELHAELTDVEEQIEAELEAERKAEDSLPRGQQREISRGATYERTEAAANQPPAA